MPCDSGAMFCPVPSEQAVASLRSRDAAYRCQDLGLSLASAQQVLHDAGQGDSEARRLVGIEISPTEAAAALIRIKADLALLAKDDSDAIELAGTGDQPKRASKQQYRDRVEQIYKQHNPEKLTGLDALMQKYEGKEAELYKKICEKYDEQNKDYPIASFHTTLGVIRAELYLDRVPVTASNFIDLAQNGFYDGLHFHRVVAGVIAQFGCPHARDPKSTRAGTGNPPDGVFTNLQTGEIEKRSGGGNIRDEYVSKDSNRPGTLSMANSGYPQSSGSQFFINLRHNASLDWFTDGTSKHPVFGKVIEGFEVCKAIGNVKTLGENPVVPVKVNSVSVSFES